MKQSSGNSMLEQDMFLNIFELASAVWNKSCFASSASYDNKDQFVVAPWCELVYRMCSKNVSFPHLLGKLHKEKIQNVVKVHKRWVPRMSAATIQSSFLTASVGLMATYSDYGTSLHIFAIPRYKDVGNEFVHNSDFHNGFLCLLCPGCFQCQQMLICHDATVHWRATANTVHLELNQNWPFVVEQTALEALFSNYRCRLKKNLEAWSPRPVSNHIFYYTRSPQKHFSCKFQVHILFGKSFQ